MFKIVYKGKDEEKIKKDTERAFNFIAKIFKINIPSIIVRVHSSRADYDKRLKRKSPDWEIADASVKNEINILSPTAFEKESPHSKKDFLSVLRHEFAHKFISKLSKNLDIPRWLDEGLAQYVSGQGKGITLKPKDIKEGFSKKIAKEASWKKETSLSYDTSFLFVDFLIKKYSFNKIKELISSPDRDYDYSYFEKIFFKIYKKELTEVEKLFIENLTKKQSSFIKNKIAKIK